MTERGPMSSPLFKREDGIAHWANGPVALVSPVPAIPADVLDLSTLLAFETRLKTR